MFESAIINLVGVKIIPYGSSSAKVATAELTYCFPRQYFYADFKSAISLLVSCLIVE